MGKAVVYEIEADVNIGIGCVKCGEVRGVEAGSGFFWCSKCNLTVPVTWGIKEEAGG